MGVLNVTPDSFSDGGRFFSTTAAIAHGLRMVEAGADIIDIGGESTRPNATPVDADTELQRVLPVIAGILRQCDVAISIDTHKPSVMHAALDAGAAMVNDVNALQADGAIALLAQYPEATVCLMHMQGTPATMQQHPHYVDVVSDVYNFLKARIDACIAGGIAQQRLCIDPGIGFGKTVDHNATLLAALPHLRTLDCPILVGVSRKSMLGEMAGNITVEERLVVSIAAMLFAFHYGADIVRVHDVQSTREALTVWQQLDAARAA